MGIRCCRARAAIHASLAGIGEPLAFNSDRIEGVINGYLLGGRGSRFFIDRRRELLLVHCHSWNGLPDQFQPAGSVGP